MTATDDVGSALYDNDADTFNDNDFAETGEKTPRLLDLGDEPKSDEKAPRAHTKREPIAQLATLLWGGAGMALVRTGADVPVGRVLQFQAPLAGKKIDDLIAGTWLDMILQPFARQADKVEGLGALVLFPLMVGAYERNPALGPMLEPIMRQVVHATLVDMAPVLKKQQAETKRAAAAVADLNGLFDLEESADPIDAIFASIFAPVQQETGDAVESEG